MFGVTFENAERFTASFESANSTFSTSFVSDCEFQANMGVVTEIQSGDQEYYRGPYEITPNGTEQTLSTRGKALTRDIVVHKVPEQYGLISYNGAVITVS